MNALSHIPGEQVLLVVRKHWATLLGEAFGRVVLVLILITAFTLTRFYPSTLLHVLGTLMAPPAVLLLWVSCFPLWMRYRLTMLILTDRRVLYISQTGIAEHEIVSWNIPDIKRLNISTRGFFDSYFGCGSITIQGKSGESGVSIDGVFDPEYVCAMVLKQDDRYSELLSSAKKQHDLLRFVSHEIKGHLTRSKAAFASIVEGDYGPVTPELGSLAQDALQESQKGVETVMSLLDNAQAAKGDMSYTMRPFNLSETLLRMVIEFRPAAQRKGLSLTSSIEPGCMMNGDEQKISHHLVRNLIENAIRYTPRGTVDVQLDIRKEMIRLVVRDTGVGIDAADKDRLFTQGGSGTHAKEVNPDSTGYGLFVARQVALAHKGSIELDSEGVGRGTRATVIFPWKEIK